MKELVIIGSGCGMGLSLARSCPKDINIEHVNTIKETPRPNMVIPIVSVEEIKLGRDQKFYSRKDENRQYGKGYRNELNRYKSKRK